MHRTLPLAVIALCLFSAALQASHGWGGWGRPPRISGSPPAPLTKTFIIRAKTIEDARDVALEQAAEWIEDQPQFGWRPTADVLRAKGLLQQRSVAEENLPIAGTKQTVTFELVLPPDVVAELRDKGRERREQVREERVVGREWLFARVLGGALGVIVVVGGYLRLEEATRGYYAYLLRLTAGVVLGLIGAVVYFLG
jgi:hypothetical protein